MKDPRFPSAHKRADHEAGSGGERGAFPSLSPSHLPHLPHVSLMGEGKVD